MMYGLPILALKNDRGTEPLLIELNRNLQIVFKSNFPFILPTNIVQDIYHFSMNDIKPSLFKYEVSNSPFQGDLYISKYVSDIRIVIDHYNVTMTSQELKVFQKMLEIHLGKVFLD